MFTTFIMPFLMVLRYLLLSYGVIILISAYKNSGGQNSKIELFENKLVQIIIYLALAISIYFDLSSFGQDYFWSMLNWVRIITVVLIVLGIVIRIKNQEGGGKVHARVKKFALQEIFYACTQVLFIIMAVFLPSLIQYVIANPTKFYALKFW